MSADTRRPGSPFHPALLQPCPQALLRVAPSRAQARNSPPTGLDYGRYADHRTFAGLAEPERPCRSASRPRGKGALLCCGRTLLIGQRAGFLAARRQDPSPLRRSLKVHSWKGRSLGVAAVKGRGLGRAASRGGLGAPWACHKVNGRRRGVALLCEAHSPPLD